jgi:sodium-dependent phosphate cotransporter
MERPMTSVPLRSHPSSARQRFWVSTFPRILALITLLYAFLTSIGLLGKAFKLLGGGFVDGLIQSASNPLVGLFVGILATTLVQSSSTTTSLVVAMVGGGSMSVATAIPVIMGANIGTSVTNTLVSLGHITRGREFYRAFSASTVHDFYNVLAVVALFPLQIMTDFLGRSSSFLANVLKDIGGLEFTSPLRTLTAPTVRAAVTLMEDWPWLLLIASLAIMFGSLRYLVVTMRSLVLSRVETLFDRVIFRNAAWGMLFGMMLTVLVQSSSITTSLVIPLAGAGILTLRQIFPYTLGANVGTTVTAMLASLAVGEVSALTVAFAHLLFNCAGILIIWPVPGIRKVPQNLARRLARLSIHNRWFPILYILLFFYLLPLLVILLLR